MRGPERARRQRLGARGYFDLKNGRRLGHTGSTCVPRNSEHLRGRACRDRVHDLLRLGRNAGHLRSRAKSRPREEVVHAITAGTPTKVAGIPGTRGAGMTEPAPVLQIEKPGSTEPLARGSARSARRPRELAGDHRARARRPRLRPDGAELLHAGELHEHHHADGGHMPARLRRRLRAPDRRDRPLGQPSSAASPASSSPRRSYRTALTFPGTSASSSRSSRRRRSAPSRDRSSRSSAFRRSSSRSPASRSGRA